MNNETPITFEATSFAIFDIEANAVRTTKWGNLAIFSTRGVAQQTVDQLGSKCKIVPVKITPVTEQ